MPRKPVVFGKRGQTPFLDGRWLSGWAARYSNWMNRKVGWRHSTI